MKLIVFLFLLSALQSCQHPEPTFLTSTRSYSGKLYFFSGENHLDRTRKVSVLCVGMDSAMVYSRYQVVPFDSIDYFYLDTSYDPNHTPDSALAFFDNKMKECLGGVAVQLPDEFAVTSRKKLVHKEISKDPRLSLYK